MVASERYSRQGMQMRQQCNTIVRLDMVQSITEHFKQSVENPPSFAAENVRKQLA